MSVLIALAPTIIFALILVYQIIRGFMRGQRKSIYLLINMAIAMVISLGLFLSWTNIGGLQLVMDGAGLDESVEGVVNFEIGEKSFEVATAYISLVVNFVVLTVIQLFVYPFVKAVLYVIYLLVLRRKVVEDKDCGDRKRIGGMLIGALRGVVIGFLVFSQFSTFYYVVAGGVFYTSDEYDSLDLSFADLPGLTADNADLVDEIYKGFKTSRNNGLGMVFDKLTIGDTSLDYLLLDLTISGSYENFKGDKSKVTLREEFGNLLGVVTTCFDTGLVKFVDGEFTPDYSKLQDEKVLSLLTTHLERSNLFVDGIPTILIDFVNCNEDVLNMQLSDEMIKNLNIKDDIEHIATILASFITMIDFSSDNPFTDIDFLNLDADTVDVILDCLSQITLMTEVLLPLGVNFVSAAVEDLTFDLEGIVWNEELQNVVGLYKTLQELGLSEGFSELLLKLELAIAENHTDTLEKLDSVINQVFNSDLVHRLTVGVIQSTVMQMGGEEFELNIDTSEYTKALLKTDVELLVDTVVGGYSLYKQLTSEDFFTTGINEIDIPQVKLMILGSETDSNVKGVLDLNFLNVCVDKDEFFKVLFELATGGVVELPLGLDWENEISVMLDVIQTIQESDVDLSLLMTGDLTSLSSLTEDQSDKLTTDICSSKLMTSMFVGTLVGDGSEDSGLSFLEIPKGLDWYGNDSVDGEMKNLLDSIFLIVRKPGALDGLLEGNFMDALNTFTKADFDELLTSQVLTATISVQLTTIANSGAIIIPSSAYENDYISKEELLSVLNVFLSLNIDFTDINLDVLFDDAVNYNDIFASSIITATISSMMNNVDGLVIPSSVVTDGVINASELINLMEALRSLNITDFSSIDIETLLDSDMDVLFESEILSATISKMFTEVLNIPTEYYTNDSTKVSIVTDGIIAKEHIVAYLTAIKVLNLELSDTNIDLSMISNLNQTQKDTLTDSLIMCSILSGFDVVPTTKTVTGTDGTIIQIATQSTIKNILSSI